MKILLFGNHGQLGRRLEKELAVLGPVTAYGRSECDITDRARVRQAITECTPAIIVNAAAYTQVDKAESEPALSQLVNETGPRNIALEAAQTNAALIHYSTDYVFDGSSSVPYRETDSAIPQNQYGKSKLAGDSALGEIGIPLIILRIGWLYSTDSTSFLSRMMLQFKDKAEVSVVEDQRGTPTSADFIAGMTRSILQKTKGSPADYFAQYGGLYHLGCLGEASWFEFAGEILRLMKSRNMPVKIQTMRAISSSAYPSVAKKPIYSKLNVDKFRKMFEFEPPDWKDNLAQIMVKMK
jgi:dTDP-4-dehydrorhamnose reductase